jgi:NADPH-dependent 2,4-dienoyl-CoA reductase/sulfur reductase-like enzyme
VQNTQAGREAALAGGAATKADPPKKIVVVGAGPAGMAAALAAARKGHAVTVYERQGRSGGQVNMARQSAGRGNMAQLTRYLQNALERLEVPVRVGQALDADQVLALRADAVVLATGCHPAGHPYPGEYGPPRVLTVWDVYQDRHPIGDKVLLIDEIGSHITLASAELLAEQGKQVTVLTCDLFVGVGIATLGDLYLTRQRLLQKGAVFQPDVAVERIDGATVSARNVFSNAPLTYEGYDTIIVAAEFVAEDSLYYQLKGKVRHLHRVGDCVAPRGIRMAIYEGEQAGSRL